MVEKEKCFGMLSGVKELTAGKHLEKATKIMPDMPEIIVEILETEEGERLDEEKATQSSCSMGQGRGREGVVSLPSVRKAQVPGLRQV